MLDISDSSRTCTRSSSRPHDLFVACGGRRRRRANVVFAMFSSLRREAPNSRANYVPGHLIRKNARDRRAFPGVHVNQLAVITSRVQFADTRISRGSNSTNRRKNHTLNLNAVLSRSAEAATVVCSADPLTSASERASAIAKFVVRT